MKNKILALLLAGSTLLSACGGKTAAATMHLRKAEGTVTVFNEKRDTIAPREDLGLYSGYGVDTQASSYAWIDLDSVKLTKLDEKSEIAITKEGKHLEIEVLSGSLFFNVTEPLEEDETLNIRTSTMLVGIRGTCGWVEVPEDNGMSVYLLEGRVECTAGDQTATVSAGKMAKVASDGTLTVKEFTASRIPAFVREELEGDSSLVQDILDNSGLAVLNPADPQEEFARKAALLEVLNSSAAAYAGLFDMDGDGREDLLLLNKVGQYARFRWTAYLWDGNTIQSLDLTSDFDEIAGYTTDDLYTTTAGVCRERDTGILYVHYYSQIVDGMSYNFYVSVTDSEALYAPSVQGSFDGTEEDEVQRQKREQERQEYDAALAARFETLADLDVGWLEDAEDYTYTIEEVRRQLESEG